MDFEKLIIERYSVRNFKPEHLPQEVVDKILEAGHKAPTGCNYQPQRILVLNTDRSITRLKECTKCHFNAHPEVLQVHNSNISRYLPYNGCTSKTKSDTYAIRSSYSSSWGGAFYNTVFQSMDENDLKWAKSITEEYLRIRKYFSADFYDHGSSAFDPFSWAIWQYHDPETQSGIVMAFRRSESPFETVSIDLKGLIDGEIYSYYNFDSGLSFESGSSLTVALPEKRSSAIIEYRSKV